MSSFTEQTESNLSVVFTGGGTGGHLYPALALAKALKRQAPDARILFIGTARLEAEKVPAEGFPIRIISVRGLAGSWKSPKGLLRKLISAALLGLGIPVWQSLAILRKFKPNLVVGTGGYVCGPVILAARLLKIPSMSVEQNVYPGLTTRALARLVNAAALICDESVTHYPTPHGPLSRPGLPRLVVTGNPIREEILKAK
jgi:UDP-N-acetylglucosamine--N-acetylmuramyl-(pentapeptide) pyrophosphoryl-undecaprenol N-acetylglucosamine transferase